MGIDEQQGARFQIVCLGLTTVLHLFAFATLPLPVCEAAFSPYSSQGFWIVPTTTNPFSFPH